METQVGTVESSRRGRRRLLGAGVAGATSLGALAWAAAPAAADDAAGQNVYDVTKWRVSSRPGLTARQDIGAVINDIIRDIKRRRPDRNAKPGAAIIIPPGDYDLRTPVVVDISYLTIAGYGHGFTSLSIRYNVDTTGWTELNPGGSHIRVLTQASTAAFTVHRDTAPRLSSIVFRDFCLDGVSFAPDQNSYRNGRTGIDVSSDNDSLHMYPDSAVDAVDDPDLEIDDGRFMVFVRPSGRARQTKGTVVRLAVDNVRGQRFGSATRERLHR